MSEFPEQIKISQLREEYVIRNQDYIVLNVDDQVTSKINFVDFTHSFTSQNLIWSGNIVFTGSITLPPGAEEDPLFTASPAFTITAEDIIKWNTAYGWGDHSVQGYIKSYELPKGFIMPGDNVSLLENDVPYAKKSELDDAINNLDLITIEDINNILDVNGYLKPGDPISLLNNNVPYLTEYMVLCILDGKTAGCNPDPTSRGYLKRSVGNVPLDKVSELENDVPYLTEQNYIDSALQFLRRKDDDGNYRDLVSELENDVKYLLHEWDGEPLTGYDIEILSNVVAGNAIDGEILIKQGDEWVNVDPTSGFANLRFVGQVDVSFPPYETYEAGDILVQHKDNGNPGYADEAWTIVNIPFGREVRNHQWMVKLQSGDWVLLGNVNDQLQSNWKMLDVWHPAYIRNKPTSITEIDPNLPSTIGDGRIEVKSGGGIKVTGDVGTANQSNDTAQTVEVDAKLGGGINIDGNGQIEVDFNLGVGDGLIDIIPGQGINVRHLYGVPNANQKCSTETVIEVDGNLIKTIDDIGQLVNKLNKFDSSQYATIDYVDNKNKTISDRVSDLENLVSKKLGANFSNLKKLT